MNILALLVAAIIFIIPFTFIALTAAKDKTDASSLRFTFPVHFQLIDNIVAVIQARNYVMITALINSAIITVVSVFFIVLLSALIAYVLQRRRDRAGSIVALVVLAGLIIPPAVVPTIVVLQALGLFKTLAGLIVVEIAFTMPFAVLVLRAFVGTIPREIDEAAVMDGAGPLTLVLQSDISSARPAVLTVVIVTSVAIYNDFVNPAVLSAGNGNETAQLTLFNFQSQFNTQWNLLFSDVLIITIPPLLLSSSSRGRSFLDLPRAR